MWEGGRPTPMANRREERRGENTLFSRGKIDASSPLLLLAAAPPNRVPFAVIYSIVIRAIDGNRGEGTAAWDWDGD